MISSGKKDGGRDGEQRETLRAEEGGKHDRELEQGEGREGREDIKNKKN